MTFPQVLIYSPLPSKTFLRAHHFFLILIPFIFISHFFCGLAAAYMNSEAFFFLCIPLVCQITHSFLNGFQPNLYLGLLPCMLYLSCYFQPEVSTGMYLRKSITLQADSCHSLDPWHKLLDTQSVLMYLSVLKVKKSCGLDFFKIKLQTSSAYIPPQSSNICLQQVDVLPSKNQALCQLNYCN